LIILSISNTFEIRLVVTIILCWILLMFINVAITLIPYWFVVIMMLDFLCYYYEYLHGFLIRFVIDFLIHFQASWNLDFILFSFLVSLTILHGHLPSSYKVMVIIDRFFLKLKILNHFLWVHIVIISPFIIAFYNYSFVINPLFILMKFLAVNYI